MLKNRKLYASSITNQTPLTTRNTEIYSFVFILKVFMSASEFCAPLHSGLEDGAMSEDGIKKEQVEREDGLGERTCNKQ